MHEWAGMIEECWDQDAEARLSASCALERLMAMERQSYSWPDNYGSLLLSEDSTDSAVSPNSAVKSAVQEQSGVNPAGDSRVLDRRGPDSNLDSNLDSTLSTSSAVCSSNSTQDSSITFGPPTISAGVYTPYPFPPHHSTPLAAPQTAPLSVMVPISPPQTVVTTIYPPSRGDVRGIPPQAV